MAAIDVQLHVQAVMLEQQQAGSAAFALKTPEGLGLLETDGLVVPQIELKSLLGHAVAQHIAVRAIDKREVLIQKVSRKRNDLRTA